MVELATGSRRPAYGVALFFAAVYHSTRLSGLPACGKVSAFGYASQRRPRSRMVLEMPAWARRNAEMPPPKPEPMMSTRCSAVGFAPPASG